MQGVKRVSLVGILLAMNLLTGCGDISIDVPPLPDPPDVSPPDNGMPQPKTFTFDFADGQQGWEAGFSDYDADNADIFNLASEVQPLPDGSGDNGFLLASDNRSDDIFMFLKQAFADLEPNTTYTLQATVDLMSNAGEGCIGIGGAPGESVYIKLGHAEIEPEQEGYYLNVDQGAQSNDGNNASVIGNAAAPEIGCEGTEYGRKRIETDEQTQVEFMSTADGTIWLFIGSDSGFEGRTELFYDRITLTLTPQV